MALKEGLIVTPPAMLSYAHLFKPWAGKNRDQDPKYSATLVFPAGTDLSALKAAVIAVAKKRFGEKAESMLRSGSLRSPFTTGEVVEEKGYPAGSTYISAKSKTAPGVASRYADPETGRPIIITEEMQQPGNPYEVYSGCQVVAIIKPYAYDNSGNRGVTFDLKAVQKLADGKRLDNSVDPAQVFEATELAPEMPSLPEGMDD